MSERCRSHASRSRRCCEIREPSVRLQATIALGRIGHAEAIPALLPVLAESDVYLAYSAREALKRIDDWRAAAKGLDSPDPKIRAGVLLAMEQVYDAQAAGALALFASSSKRAVVERTRALAYLAEVHRKAPPWNGRLVGHAARQHKPPAKTIAWEGTPRVMTALRELLTDRSAAVRTGGRRGDREDRQPRLEEHPPRPLPRRKRSRA